MLDVRSFALDLDCSNILSYPPADFAFRLANQAHVNLQVAIQRVLW